MDGRKVVFGGDSDRASLRIEPTVMDNVDFSDAVMGEEIFGPILPVLTFKNINEAVKKINSRPHPMALYMFSEDRKTIKFVMSRRCV